MTGLPTPDHIREQCDELAVLLPALPDALPRDTGTSPGERVTTSENIHGAPVNVDVADALRTLPHPGYLDTYRRDYTDAYDNHRTADAHHLATQIRAWLTTARRALGLNQPDQPLTGPQHCPDHDQPLTPLVIPGDHGHLIYDRLNQHGRPVDPWIRWDHHEIVMCRHCGREWTPAQYAWLGRLVAHANNRRNGRMTA